MRTKHPSAQTCLDEHYSNLGSGGLDNPFFGFFVRIGLRRRQTLRGHSKGLADGGMGVMVALRICQCVTRIRRRMPAGATLAGMAETRTSSASPRSAAIAAVAADAHHSRRTVDHWTE